MAYITDALAIRQILEHLDLSPTEKPPPIRELSACRWTTRGASSRPGRQMAPLRPPWISTQRGSCPPHPADWAILIRGAPDSRQPHPPRPAAGSRGLGQLLPAPLTGPLAAAAADETPNRLPARWAADGRTIFLLIREHGVLWSIDRVDVLTRTSRALEYGGALGSDRHAPGLLHPVVGGPPTVAHLDDTVSLGPVRRARGPRAAVPPAARLPPLRETRRGQGAGRCAQARGATRGVSPRRGRRRLSLHDLFSLPVPVSFFPSR